MFKLSLSALILASIFISVLWLSKNGSEELGDSADLKKELPEGSLAERSEQNLTQIQPSAHEEVATLSLEPVPELNQPDQSLASKREALISSYETEMRIYESYSLAERSFAMHKWRLRNENEIARVFSPSSQTSFEQAVESNLNH